jgi:hypothetical protein
MRSKVPALDAIDIGAFTVCRGMFLSQSHRIQLTLQRLSRQFSSFGIQIDDGTLFSSRADERGARLNPFAHTRSSSRRRMKAEILDENLEAMVGATPTRFRQSLVDSDAFIVSER